MNYLENIDLPVGWVNITVDDAVISISTNGKKIRQKEYAEQGRYAVVDQGQENIGGYTDDEEKVVDCQLPVIVFGDHTRVIKYVNQPFAAGADGIKVLQPHEFITPKYFEYCLRHFSESMTSKGYARHYQHLAKSFIPLPPLPEQHRIVAKIEELFSELDKGIESLKTAREQLKIYRQALLKHAFEGKLTAQWRAENNVGAGSKPALDADVKGGRVVDRAPTKRRKDLPSLTAEELAELPELPLGWGWVKIIDACESVVDCHNKTAPYQSTGIFLVRTTNIRDGKLNLGNDIRFVSDETYKFWSRRCPPTHGDVLFTREAPMGEAAIIPEKTVVCMGQRTMLFRPLDSKLSSLYLLHATQEPIFKKRMNAVAVGTGVKHLRVGDVERLLIPICPLKEQLFLINLLDSRLSAADNLDQTITTALQQSETLRQSILKKAFSGQLVPQNPHDEPAAVLLERIKQNKNVGARSQTRPSAKGNNGEYCCKTNVKGGRVTDRATKSTSKTKIR